MLEELSYPAWDLVKHRTNISHIVGVAIGIIDNIQFKMFKLYSFIFFIFLLANGIILFLTAGKGQTACEINLSKQGKKIAGLPKSTALKMEFVIVGKVETEQKEITQKILVRFQMLSCPRRNNFFQDSLGNDCCWHMHISDLLN